MTAKNRAADLIWRGDVPISSCPEDYVEYTAWDVETGKRLEADDYPLAEALRTGLPTTPVELRIRRFDDTEGFIIMSTALLRGTDGLLTGAVGINVDITERKRAEEALRESEEKYRRFFEQDLTADIVSTADGRIIDCNRAFLEIFGFNSTEEALNTNVIETYPSPEDRQQFLELIKKEGRIYNYSRIRKRRDGSLITVVENVVGRFNENGELTELLSFLYDDSERKRAEDALKNASRKLNLLTSITRHDILNQITALKVFLVLMQDPPHEGNEAEEMFHNLEKIADTIRRQITFTGDYQEMGERDPEWQQVEWVVKRAAESVRLNGASLAVDTGSLEFFADPMLEKVFYNLLDNAVFHGERVEHITVSFHEDGDAGVLMFEDDGLGVPASSKDMIFERGFGKITGYGLFLAKEILDITALSIRETGEEGKGARFEIEVPAGKWRM